MGGRVLLGCGVEMKRDARPRPRMNDSEKAYSRGLFAHPERASCICIAISSGSSEIEYSHFDAGVYVAKCTCGWLGPTEDFDTHEEKASG